MSLKKIKKLKTGFLSRNLSLAKMAASIGKDYYFSSKSELTDKLGEVLAGRMDLLQNELGHLKGSFLKAGQMLSLYADDLLPPEIENLFVKLQAQNPYLTWDQISKQIPDHILKALDIEKEAFAAASIGQVHRATDKEGNQFALKVQYRNIDKVIDMDLKALRLLLTTLKVLPQGLDLDNIFHEIKLMLLQEMDYEKEANFMKRYKSLVGEEFIIPEVYDDYSSSKVICSEFIDGQTLTEALPSLTQEQRNLLGKQFFELFFQEIFEWNLVQSDAHEGNYLIKDRRWVLLDFGAVKEIDKEVSARYKDLIRAISEYDKKEIRRILDDMDLIDWEKSEESVLWDYCYLISEPYRHENYDWGTSEIAKKAVTLGQEIQKKIKIKYAPHETIFIDRKISGLFYILKKLGAKGDIIPKQYLAP